jgi:hypothetical protein
MEFKDRWRTVALVAGSLLAGSLIGPPLVQAATASLVTIQGAKSTNQAKVSSTGELSVNPNLTQTAARQLLATEVAPSSFYQPGMINLPTTPTFAPVATPPSGTALVLTYLHTDFAADPTPGQGNDAVYIVGKAACTARVGTFEVVINPATDGEQDTPLSPGLGIPSGDALCATQGAGVVAAGGVSGYTVPSSEVTAEPLHRLPNLHQR